MVDFALLGGLATLIFLAVFQIGYAQHVHNTLTAHAIEGARQGARLGSTPDEGAARARELIQASLPDAYADHVSARVVTTGGVQVVEVYVTAPMPVLGPWGLGGDMDVTGRAVSEFAP